MSGALAFASTAAPPGSSRPHRPLLQLPSHQPCSGSVPQPLSLLSLPPGGPSKRAPVSAHVPRPLAVHRCIDPSRSSSPTQEQALPGAPYALGCGSIGSPVTGMLSAIGSLPFRVWAVVRPGRHRRVPCLVGLQRLLWTPFHRGRLLRPPLRHGSMCPLLTRGSRCYRSLGLSPHGTASQWGLDNGRPASRRGFLSHMLLTRPYRWPQYAVAAEPTSGGRCTVPLF
jgi:hypothetical protein